MILSRFLTLLFLTAVTSGCQQSENASFGTAIPSYWSDPRPPLMYAGESTRTRLGDRSFRSFASTSREVVLIPNYEERKRLNLSEIKNVVGVTHFFLDLDLVSGYVHQYTQNMYARLDKNEYVLKFTPSGKKDRRGTISYVRKKELAKEDALGINLAFFRQWRLSELDIDDQSPIGAQIRMDTCRFAFMCGCPQSRPDRNGGSTEIPFWNTSVRQDGYLRVTDLSKFDVNDGGTVVIIWEHKGKTWFMDVHGSFWQVYGQLKTIAQQFDVDPTMAISDAGPFARKIEADENNVLKVKKIDAMALGAKKIGAGFGYVPTQMPANIDVDGGIIFVE